MTRCVDTHVRSGETETALELKTNMLIKLTSNIILKLYNYLAIICVSTSAYIHMPIYIHYIHFSIYVVCVKNIIML